MKNRANLSTLQACCLITLFTAAAACAQGGFTGPQQTGFTGQGQQQGFVGPGPSSGIIMAQAIQALPHKTAAVLRGNIVQHLGSDRYLFRDSSGDLVIKIKHDRWWGLSVSPSDLVAIGGELKRDKRTLLVNYFDAKSIRMVQ